MIYAEIADVVGFQVSPVNQYVLFDWRRRYRLPLMYDIQRSTASVTSPTKVLPYRLGACRTTRMGNVSPKL